MENSGNHQNAQQYQSILIKKVSGREFDISETGKYVYAAICSLALADLFPEQWNKDFKYNYVTVMCQHLRLRDTVKSVMIQLAEGNSGQSIDIYTSFMHDEDVIKGKAVMIIQDMILLAVYKGEYDARERVLVRHVASLLEVPFELVELYEYSLVDLLNQHDETQTETEEKRILQREKKRKIKQYASIGIATVAGGTLIGLTGGLAAPFIGAGLGVIIGSASATAIGTTAGVAVLGSIFGVAGAGLTGYKMNKRVGAIQEFSFVPMRNNEYVEHLHIAIFVTGWLKDDDPNAVIKPWKYINVSTEQYSLKYETKYLRELGQAIEYILSIAVSFATQEALKYTILSGLMSAIAWPTALLSISSIIDNPWSVCCRRSSEVGKHLAHVLITRQHGKRPVTLIGFSLGARVIFYCLREMAEINGGQLIIQDAILLGAPVTNNKQQWEKCCKAVAGKIINGYCSSDWLLKFLYRTLSMAAGVAGLVPIDCQKVMSIDLSSIVHGHGDYYQNLTDILKYIGVKTKEKYSLDSEGNLKKSISELPSMQDSEIKKIQTPLKTCKSDLCLPTMKLCDD